MSTSLFHNFTEKDFTGYWNGRAKTFKAGAQVYMESYLAEHYAKHLVNSVLISRGDYTSTSPKKPTEVPKFMELFDKACIRQEDTDEQDSAETTTDILNRQPSSNLPPSVANKEPQIIESPVEDDDDEYEGLKDPSMMTEPTLPGEPI